MEMEIENKEKRLMGLMVLSLHMTIKRLFGVCVCVCVGVCVGDDVPTYIVLGFKLTISTPSWFSLL
jgi:hypothetical protein